MKFLWTTASRNALKEVKERMIEQHEKKDVSKFKLKFTKKKEFLAIPSPWFTCPAFQLFLNQKFYGTYIFKNEKWSTLD